MRFKIPTLNDLVIVGTLICIAAVIWVLDPSRKPDPYKDEVDS